MSLSQAASSASSPSRCPTARPGQYLKKELGKKVETPIASAKREVEESLINSFEQKLKENLYERHD